MVRHLLLVLAALLILDTFQGCSIKGEPQPTRLAAPGPSPTIYVPPTFPPTWTPYPPTPTNTRVIPIPPTHTPGPSPTPTRFPARTKAMVISIQDSRTFEVLIEGQSLNQVFRVRLLGVEAPLLSDAWNEVALNWLVHELEHQVVILESGERDRDAQGNLLRYVWKEGRMVNVAMVQLGLAIASENATTLSFGADLLDAQSNAQNAGRGLWGPPPTATPAPLAVTPTITATESYTQVSSTPTTPEPTGAMGQRDDQKTADTGAKTQNVEFVGHIGGTIGAVVVQGSYTYVGIGPELAILDTADPAQAARLGYLTLPDMVKDITVAGGYAYVADYGAGLWVVDVSHPDAPAVVSSYRTPGYVRGIELTGPYAYLASDEGLRVIDVSDPTALTEIALNSTPGIATDVIVEESYAYVTEMHCQGTMCEGSVQVIDVSDLAALAQVSAFNLPGYATERSVTLAGDYLYVADGYGGLRILNVSNPAFPTEVAIYEEVAFDVAVVGSYAYVATGESLRVIDVSNPDTSLQVGSYEGAAIRLAASGDYVYLVNNGLEVIDVSDPAIPIQVGLYAAPEAVHALAVAGGRAYLVDRVSGLLEIMDISDPVAPVLISRYDLPREAQDVAVVDHFAYVLDGDCEGDVCDGHLWVIDIGDPAAPTQVGLYTPPEFGWALTISGDYAYIANRLDGLLVVDVSNPTSPFAVGSYDTPEFAMDVALANGYAYVADRKGGLRIIDVSDPTTPVEVGFYLTPDEAWRVTVVDGYAYVATRGFGLRILDISNPSTPIEVGSLDPSGHASIYGITVVEDYAYLAASFAGLRVVDVSDPATPIEVGFYDTAGTAEEVVMADSYICVADGLGGLVIFRFVPPTSTP